MCVGGTTPEWGKIDWDVAVLNTIIEKELDDFVDDFIEGLSRAVISMDSMPDRDLFPRYFAL